MGFAYYRKQKRKNQSFSLSKARPDEDEVVEDGEVSGTLSCYDGSE